MEDENVCCKQPSPCPRPHKGLQVGRCARLGHCLPSLYKSVHAFQGRPIARESEIRLHERQGALYGCVVYLGCLTELRDLHVAILCQRLQQIKQEDARGTLAETLRQYLACSCQTLQRQSHATYAYTGLMTIVDGESVDLPTPSGPMRTHIFRPSAKGRYPALVLYSEIFQITAPIRRMAAFFAGHGYVVACPEVYHEFEPAGTVLAYDQPGSDRGNELKYRKHVAAYDADARAVVDHLTARPDTTTAVGSLGICLGGHLAFRTGFDKRVRATVCFYATDLHKGSLGRGDDSLLRAAEVRGELMMIWGRQDPHVPLEGRMTILERLNASDVRLNWLEVNGAHAFLRDEGVRYDPELAHTLYGHVLALFHRCLTTDQPD